MNPKRLEKLADFKLDQGNHKNVKQGACVMEMVSYVAGEPWSDHPQCACPVLTAVAIRLNDRADDVTRQKLKPLIPKMVNTRGDAALRRARYRFIVHRSITVTFPLFIDGINLPEFAAKLRSFKICEWKEMRAYLIEKRPEIHKAAASAAASDAAAYAAAAASAAASDAADAAASAAAYAADAAAAAADAAAASAADAAAAAASAAAAYAADAAAASAASAAASAADAAADAAAYAAAYAAADADAYAADAKKWKDLRADIWDSSIKTLELACEITEGEK